MYMCVGGGCETLPAEQYYEIDFFFLTVPKKKNLFETHTIILRKFQPSCVHTGSIV